ncbi:uncharacterized protein J3D65DRAFT_664763 [Phyllosticta citribraziliensis]|uniref:Uncharacterized protein n=1 Tax=Phyllosticta citribraziliensis TaxID=989973 RepID=A0ABR1M473_9PEZI
MPKRKADHPLSSDLADEPLAKKRTATLYDAVAGRVSSNGFMFAEPFVAKDRDTASSSRLPVPPEEVLFRMRNAPDRYEENDPYDADRHLGEHQRLPESDLVKALHAYTSDYYNASYGEDSRVDYRSMDETALLAMAILIEEAAADLLGSTGDLAFIEGENMDNIDMPRAWNGLQWARSVIEGYGTGSAAPEIHQSQPESDAADPQATSEKQHSAPQRRRSRQAKSDLDDDSASDYSQDQDLDADDESDPD